MLARNREKELRTVLDEIRLLDYPGTIETIVVDNASTDGTRAMLATRADVRAVLRETNEGVSAWNHGFDVATGEWLLVLDDDCYLERDGLAKAITAATEDRADLVSFLVRDPARPGFVFNRLYNTGLLSFWGCAVLIRRDVIRAIGGFDPHILVWAHELEFMLRFFDRGFRHLYLPTVSALHMNIPAYSDYKFLTNHRHLGYIVGARLTGWNVARALAALMVPIADGIGRRPLAPLYRRLARATLEGFWFGRTQRRAVRPEVARVYTRHFPDLSFRLRMRPAARLACAEYPRYFPGLREQASLQFGASSC